MRTLKTLLSLCLVLSTSGCSVLNINSNNEHCEPASEHRLAKSSAESLYAAMITCIKEKRENAAIKYFALAGVTTWYDVEVRPGDFNYKRHRHMLREALIKLNEKQKNTTWLQISNRLRERNYHASLCQTAKIVGEIRSKSQIFDDIAWQHAIEGYLHCGNTKKI